METAISNQQGLNEVVINKVQANDRKAAEEAIAQNCGAMLGNIQTLDYYEK